jgi:PBSX family phage terminase large subunit
VSVEGLIYPCFNRNEHIKDVAEPCEKYVVSCDYGTVNPMSIGLWGLKADKWYRLYEYYFDSKIEAYMKTDEEYYIELENLIDGRNIEMIIVDPSAASFIECINRHSKYMVKKADNNVLDGIRKTADALKHEKIYISPACTNSIREFSLYRWSDNINHEKPLKINDHAMDDIRYFVATYLMKSVDEAFFVEAVRRE